MKDPQPNNWWKLPTASGLTPTQFNLSDAPRVEGYHILRVLGEGGMGVVYLARQKHPVQREVALKIIKPGMDSQQVVARFRGEEQALALLDHANIAHVFSAGASEAGLPYFAMEYVKGIPITDYCDRHKLTIAERLHLFLPVCEAVQHAHQKGIIHRDLKPSNILVTIVSDHGVPMIIDFGVAKILSLTLTDRILVTEQGQMLGTPEYMSPEQAEMSNADIDTRSDIYSLGVILYELLTGTLPFDPRALRQGGTDHIRRMICEEDPKTPSVQLNAISGAESLKRAQACRTNTRTLSRHLHGDLDWITLKAMEKDRMRRYGSAGELAADIQRHLNDEPVEAGPPSLAYQLKKLVRRHRTFSSVVVAIVATLLIGFIINTALYIRVLRLLNVTKQAHLKETRAQAQLQATMDYVIQNLPEDDLGRNIQHLREESQGDPLVKADILLRWGDNRLTKGDYASAQELFQQAYDIRLERLTLEHASTLIALSRLGKSKVLRSHYEQAESDLKQALEKMTDNKTTGSPSFESDHPDVLVDTMLQLSLCSYYQSKNLTQMFDSLIKVHEMGQRVLGEDHPVLLETMYHLAMWCQIMGCLDDGLKLCEDGWKTCVRFVPGNELRIRFTSLLAVFRSAYAEHAEASDLASEALKMSRDVFREGHPLIIQCVWADAFVCSNQFSEEKMNAAETGFRKTVQLSEEELGKDHYMTSYYRFSHINTLIKLGEFEEAQEGLLDLLESRRRNLGEQHDWVLTTMFSVMKLYALQGKGEDLKRWCAEQISRQYSPSSDRDFVVAFIHSMLAWLQATYPDPDIRNGLEAVDNASTACSLYDDHWSFKKSLAAAHAETGDFGSAVKCQNEAIELMSKEPYVDELEAESLAYDLKRYKSKRRCREGHFSWGGHMLFLLGEHDKAEDAWKSAWKYTAQRLDPQHPETQACIMRLIEFYEAEGESNEVKTWRDRLPEGTEQ